MNGQLACLLDSLYQTSDIVNEPLRSMVSFDSQSNPLTRTQSADNLYCGLKGNRRLCPLCDTERQIRHSWRTLKN